jgi:hypothetical protein
MTKQEDYLGSLDPDELQLELEFFEDHWANDLLDSPHVLIAVIETKIARAVIAREREIIKLLGHPYFHHTHFEPRGVDDVPLILHDVLCIGCKAIETIKTIKEAQDD